jgi:hypothetical protein
MDQAPTVFPDDENGDVLRRMQRNGDDFSKARDIDFTVVFGVEDSAQKFAGYFGRLGHRVSVSNSNCVPDLPWDVIVVNHMLLSHSGITEFEETLQHAAAQLGGRNDGWGCLNQKDVSK